MGELVRNLAIAIVSEERLMDMGDDKGVASWNTVKTPLYKKYLRYEKSLIKEINKRLP